MTKYIIPKGTQIWLATKLDIRYCDDSFTTERAMFFTQSEVLTTGNDLPAGGSIVFRLPDNKKKYVCFEVWRRDIEVYEDE